MSNLVFFDNKGNHINFQYDSVSKTYNGELIFDNNGSDTFKTIALYTFEKIDSFEFESTDLSLEKFQLFNEYGFNITGSKYFNQPVIKIEAVNSDPNFSAKWIYGINFESKFPVGSEIQFDSSIFEFNNPLKTYTVVYTKKGAIMVISTLDNKTFNLNYEIAAGLTYSYENITISGINSIGVNSYLDSTLHQNLSNWSEPQFYLMLYNGRKLNLVNTNSNNTVVTIKNKDLLDKIYYQYSVNSNNLPSDSDLYIELLLKTNLPIVYRGELIISSNIIEFPSGVPELLKPGYQFIIRGSDVNKNYYNVGNIPTFLGNSYQAQYYYATGSQVLWNNSIYQCYQAYTQSATSSITPDNIDYWSANITYLPVTGPIVPETLIYGEVYLTTNRLLFGVSASKVLSGTVSNYESDLTLAFAAEKYSTLFDFFNINLSYDKSVLTSRLNYSSDYAEVNYYYIQSGVTYSIGSTEKTYEKTIQIEEVVTTEFNRNISQRSSYNIVFTAFDEYGLIVTINGLVYQQEIQWAYTGLNVDMPRTVDLTLRAWLSKYYTTLFRLGISANLDYLVNYPYIYFDSITLRSIYPNVPLNFSIGVGIAANYYIQHSNVVFYQIGNSLTLIINGYSYSVNYTGTVSGTLELWIETYSTILEGYGIYVSYINNCLYFNIKSQTTLLDYTVSIGQSVAPGSTLYEINNKISGNLGALITSNAAKLSSGSSASFYQVSGNSNDGSNIGFATGMITSVNNTIYPFNNQEYNILEVDSDRLVFSYQGPFWGATMTNYCSPFVIAAFDNGFTFSICQISGPTGGTANVVLGAYNQYEFDFSFDLFRGDSNTYNYSLSSAQSNMVDLVYLNNTDSVYVLGNNIGIYDGLSGDYIESISLPGLSQSLKLIYNNINDCLYALTTTTLYKIDPTTNFINNEFALSGNPYDCIINTKNGDVYVSYSSKTHVDIFDVSGSITGITSSYVGPSYGTFKMAYNHFEDMMYITTGNDIVISINGSTRLESNFYSVNNLQKTISYNPINSTIYVMGDNLYQIINNSISPVINVAAGVTFSEILYNNISQSIDISVNGFYDSIDIGNNLRYTLGSLEYGYLSINQYDERVYMYGGNNDDIIIIDPSNGYIANTISLSSTVTKLIYNPLRKSMWGIIPSTNKIIEITVELSIYIVVSPPTYNGIYSSQYGTLDPDYQNRPSVWLKTRSYIRKPRENYQGDYQVEYVWKWLTDDIPQIFMYDFSGSQLPTTGPYAYIGEKPLQNINLNLNPNKDISKTASSAYQQTIFNEIVTPLDYVNSSVDVSYTPEPLELFVGFNSQDEGVVSSTLLLLKRESISLTLVTNAYNLNIISFETLTDSDTGNYYGKITLDNNSTENFLYGLTGSNTGLKVGQFIQLSVKDNTNSKNKYISFNNSITFKITELYIRSMVVQFVNGIFESETTFIQDYPSNGKVTYMTTTFDVLDNEVGRFILTGQTEIEDIRYKTELTNLGKNITADDVFIFKTYDIEEQGVDWLFLNQKRKEMLLMKDSIYPYVGSYKAIINAINYFGYNDLELYEYYRNINQSSTAYGHLFKVEISGIFDNKVPGWKSIDYLSWTMPNPNYEDTNLFNLTYRITDIDGNNVLLYSLAEVQIKLGGLKSWLERNVIPISHKILDITGRADIPAQNSIIHKNYNVKMFTMDSSMTPIDFNMNEAYLMPVNSGSTVYNVIIDFHTAAFDNPRDYLTNTVPNYFGLKIRTYHTYPEWKPFQTYQNGDIVSYYQQNYTSVVDNNRLHDPRKLQDSPTWDINFDYQQGQIVEYKRNFYEYIGTQSSLSGATNSIVSPFADVLNNLKHWVDITEWRKLDYVPIQSFEEFRTGTHSYHFTVDTNIDPYITVEVTSDNGYSQIYSSKKNYELRSILDINEEIGTLDVIGPIKVYHFLTSTTTSTTTVPIVIMERWVGIDGYCESTPTTTTTSTTTTTTTIFLDCGLAGNAVYNAPVTTSTTTTTTTLAPGMTTTTTSTTTTTTTAIPFFISMSSAGSDPRYASTGADACTNTLATSVAGLYTLTGAFANGGTVYTDSVGNVTYTGIAGKYYADSTSCIYGTISLSGVFTEVGNCMPYGCA